MIKSKSFLPRWTKRVTMEGSGRDPLGLTRVSDEFTGFLLPSIITITPRARYFSFYTWAIRECRKAFEEGDLRTFDERLRCIDTAFAISSRFGRTTDLTITGIDKVKSAMHINWRASDHGEGTSAKLPGMITDVTVAWPDRKLILDCKYYQEALVSRYDALRFRSGNLYQLNAYLTNKAIEPGWENVEGMLLYPSNGYRFDHALTLHGCHQIRVSTIDLQQPWPEIEQELQGLFLSPAPTHSNFP